MSPQVQMSLAETTLNRIWNADRKRGQTFWSNMGEQFKIMEEAFAEVREKERAAMRAELERMKATEKRLRKALYRACDGLLKLAPSDGMTAATPFIQLAEDTRAAASGEEGEK